MNWEAIGAIGEIVSAAFVIVTLVYLSIQIRNNTKEVKTENIHRVTDSFNQLNLLIAENEDLAQLWHKGFDNFDDLSHSEKARLNFLWLSAFRIYDSLFYQIKHGTGDEELWKSEMQTLKWIFSSPGHRQWWNQSEFGFSPGFREFIDINYMDQYENDN